MAPFSEQRAETILLDSVVRPDRFWLRADVAGSLYEARRNVLIGRVSPGVQAGWRSTFWGAFVGVEHDRTTDFTLDTETLDVLNLGVGGEFLNFMGHVRTSLMVGWSVLLADTEIDEAGEVGWFVDLRPGGLRWGIGEEFAFELTPVSVDIIAPVTDGIPLIVFTYMTLIGVEWAP